MPSAKKTIYLTFDDGPVPDVTDFVLNQLELFQAKATFFCVGENVQRNPEGFLKILKSGHSVGNHTHNHLKGWKAEDSIYFENVHQCAAEIQIALKEFPQLGASETLKLFRPPYGKIKKSQIQQLEKDYKIIMWTVLAGDFDQKQPPETCLREAIRYTSNGSIVIFHDSMKAWKSLEYALPRYLEHFTSLGYRFDKL